MTDLPRATSSMGCVVLICPWCREDMDDATVRLDALVEGWEGESPEWPARRSDGQALTPLVTDCPSCARPSMVALSGSSTGMAGDVRFVKLVPVRTRTDARLEGGDA
jgi:hypothetical protein